MLRARTLRVGCRVAATAALLLLLPAAPAAADDVKSFSFERSLDGWTPDHFIDCEQEPTPCRFDWSITRSGEQAKQGAASLKAFLNGIHDDGTIWLERKFALEADEDAEVRISFWLRSEFQGDINTWPVLAYSGRKNPETEADFTVVGQTERRAGWSRYTLETEVEPGQRGVWVAFGFGATWESERTYFLDAVQVEVDD